MEYVPWGVPRIIVCRSFKSFDENKYKDDISMTPFHVSYTFNDTDEVVWCHNKLLGDVVDIHALLKQRMLKKDSVPYMKDTIQTKSTQKSLLGFKTFIILGSI